MRRRLSTLCSFVSLLLCAAACTLWVHSYNLKPYGAVFYGLTERTHDERTATLRLTGAWSSRGMLAVGREETWWGDRLGIQSQQLEEERREPRRFGAARRNYSFPRIDRDNWWGPNYTRPVFATAFFAGRESHRYSSSGGSRTGVAVPYWVLAGGLLIAPTCWSIAAVRQRRWRAKGLCPACGYDLRATPERCPECGAVPPRRGEVVAAAPPDSPCR